MGPCWWGEETDDESKETRHTQQQWCHQNVTIGPGMGGPPPDLEWSTKPIWGEKFCKWKDEELELSQLQASPICGWKEITYSAKARGARGSRWASRSRQSIKSISARGTSGTSGALWGRWENKVIISSFWHWFQRIYCNIEKMIWKKVWEKVFILFVA